MDSIFESVFGDIHAFVYRCRNDSDYTMEYMTDGVERITGYAKSEILHNAGVSYVGLTPEIDRDRVFGEVDAAIEAGKSWDMTHRLVHRQGHHVWVRERGTAIFEDGKLSHLQGLVVGAEAESALRESLEHRIAEIEAASSNIVGLTQQITGSVRALSMLSVNARIEAARSGPAGQGFAVVANEIKTLADQNARFAEQITDQVHNMGH
ncbi:PAS domain-containing protein [uncultured Tateyamaria sp.]|uniref:PAS domain-containing protein n=1 Tax=uncultured Tateyamaria sp. TaxID=455651 RepID=UPI0026380013|nr:PAS domain-containing protein [uncultured Tateyamaria sp.]